MTLKSKEHSQRIITAICGVSLIGAIYYFLGHSGVQLICIVLSLISYLEFVDLTKSRANTPQLALAKRVVALFAAILFLLPIHGNFIWALCLLIGYSLSVYRQGSAAVEFGDQAHHLQDLFSAAFGLFYVLFFFGFVPKIHALPQGPIWVLTLLGIIWGGDIAAYYVGNIFGKHKLSPAISPGKTLEGAMGNFLGAALVSITIWYVFLRSQLIAFPTILGLALVTAFVSQVGDLFESAIKRVSGAKDSGWILPGHGGMLDRFDSLLLAAPFYFYYLSQFLS